MTRNSSDSPGVVAAGHTARVRKDLPPHARRRHNHAEEADLIRAAQAGDTRAEASLIIAHEGFVHAVAATYITHARADEDRRDILAAGRVGLLLAIRRFDPERGVRLITYAKLPIKQHCLEAATRAATAVHYPSRSWGPTEDSLNRPAGVDQDGEEEIDRLAAPDAPPPDTIAGDRLWAALDALPSGQRGVVMAHFIGERTVAEIAAELGITRQGVDARIAKGLASLRRVLPRDVLEALAR